MCLFFQSLCSVLLCVSISLLSHQVGDNTRDFVRNRQLLMDLAGAVGTLLQTVNKVATLAGSTSRVGEVLDSVNEIQVRCVFLFSHSVSQSFIQSVR